jgi:hypothetical protein
LLADGGRKSSYAKHVAPTLGQLAAAGQEIDIVYVSHIDEDHIAGLVQMVEDLVDWVARDFQHDTGNTDFPEPENPRPPRFKALWHNAFRDQVDLNLGELEDLLVLNMRACLLEESLAQQAHFYDNLIAGEREALRLSSLAGPNLLNIPVNPDFAGGLMFLDDPPPVVDLGSMRIHIIGPTTAELKALRDDWNDWVRNNKEKIQDIRDEAREDAERLHQDDGTMLQTATLALAAELRQEAEELGDRSGVTPPNLASLMLLVEEDGQSILLTGDGHADDIRQGLQAHGKIDDDHGIHVDVLKVQHHGAEYNLDEAFCQYVTADHYVFCGNGSHENPNLNVVKAIVDSRLGAEAANSKSPGVDRPFELWFNSSSAAANTESRRSHMREVEAWVEAHAQASQGQIQFHFLIDEPLFEIVL